jgi:hypothetical protein
MISVNHTTEASAAGVRPEVELLLRCARTCVDSEGAKRIGTLLQKNIDWAYLIETAKRHDVIPLLYFSLKATHPESVPKPILNQLQEFYLSNDLRNLLLTRELLRLLNLFREHGITSIPFKGPVIAASAYRNLSLRTFKDLDILVHKQDVLEIKRLLISSGYRPETQMTDKQEKAHLKANRARGFVRDDGKSLVDIHWGVTLLRYFSFPTEDEHLWERLEPVSLAGAVVRSFPPEDLLQIICTHESRHRWQQLKGICDVAELIRNHPRLEWGQVLEQAGRLGNRRMLFLGLLLARNLLGTSLPEHVMQRIEADPAVKSLATWVCKRLFRETEVAPRFSAQNYIFYFKVRERLRDKLQLCLQHYCPSFLHYFRKAMTPNAGV